jgi:hypothetical protein
MGSSSVDLSNLKLVEEPTPEILDDQQYVDAKEFPPPVPEGLYLFLQGAPTFGVTGKGLLKADMDHTISGGEHDGAKLMFDSVSETQFARSGVTGMSSMKDQIRAVYGTGTPERSARTRSDMATAIAAAEGKPFKAKTQWEGGCGHKGTEHEGKDWVRVKYAKSFPGGNDVPCSLCGNPIRPRARISLRIAAD